ncbi:unnamed protein product, partial [Prorocentrum cordatum]
MVVLKKMMNAGRKSGKSRPKVVLLFAIHVLLRLRLDCDYEELCQKDVSEVIRALVFYKLMMMWATATMGHSELDLRYLCHGHVVHRASDTAKVNPAQADDADGGGGIGSDPGDARGAAPQEQCSDSPRPPSPAAPLGSSRGTRPGQPAGIGPSPGDSAKDSGTGLADDLVAILAEKSRALQRRRSQVPAGAAQPGAPAQRAVGSSGELLVLCRSIHPLCRLLLRSTTVPWIFQVVALLDAVFGSLMLMAAFYGASASPSIPECAGPDDVLGNLFRDMLVSLGSVVVVLAPLAILSRRDRTMPRVSTDREVQTQLRMWFLKDVACIVGGLLWFAFSVLYIMLFLANVSHKDADHWLISLLIRFVSTWLLLPFIVTILWMILMKFFARLNGGSFIERNINGLLRAVSRGEGGRAREPAPEDVPKPSLPVPRALPDPPPLLHEGADDRGDWSLDADGAGVDPGEGAARLRTRLAEPSGSATATSDSEEQFRRWVDSVRLAAASPPRIGQGGPRRTEPVGWPPVGPRGSGSGLPPGSPAAWSLPPPPLLDAPRPPPPWAAAVDAGGGGLPPGPSAGWGLPPPPLLEASQPPPAGAAAADAGPTPAGPEACGPPAPGPPASWGGPPLPLRAGEAPQGSAQRLAQAEQLLALSPREAARRMRRERPSEASPERSLERAGAAAPGGCGGPPPTPAPATATLALLGDPTPEAALETHPEHLENHVSPWPRGLGCGHVRRWWLWMCPGGAVGISGSRPGGFSGCAWEVVHPALVVIRTAQLGCAMGISGVTGAMAMTLHGRRRLAAGVPARLLKDGGPVERTRRPMAHGTLRGVRGELQKGVPSSELLPAVALIGGGGIVGGAIGKAVDPMALPQTVAAFHSFVGLAAVATCLSSYMIHPHAGIGHKVGAMLGNLIGGITATGSLVAFGKLNGNMSSKPLSLPNKNLINAGMAGGHAAMLALFCASDSVGLGTGLMYATTALSGVLGYHLVASVGGGDMPCCVTVLNSYSGWALVAEGMLLDSPTLTVVGSLIGFSGAILTKIMCDAMNRDILNVIFGGMATPAPKKNPDGIEEAPK